MNSKVTNAWALVLLALAVVAVSLSTGACRTVESGFVGVKKRFGAVAQEPLQPGVHFVIPMIETVIPLETRLKSFEVEASAASKDLQIVKTRISVQHSLTPAKAPLSYAEIGDLDAFDAALVSPAVMESLKAVTAKYTAEELITKREMVKQQTSDAVQAFISHTLKEKGLDGALHIANIAIKDFDFSAEFNNSIEAKVRAQQEALRAENEKTKRITEAEAGYQEKKLAAEAEAFQIEQTSTQRAKAIEREAKALGQNPQVLQLRAIEKWNGAVPVFSGGQQPVPFINMGALPTQPQPAPQPAPPATPPGR